MEHWWRWKRLDSVLVDPRARFVFVEYENVEVRKAHQFNPADELAHAHATRVPSPTRPPCCVQLAHRALDLDGAGKARYMNEPATRVKNQSAQTA
jgi:hypothetical protein